MNKAIHSSTKYLAVGIILIIAVIITMLILAKRDHTSGLNHDFHRKIKYVSIDTAQGFEVNQLDVQKLKVRNHHIFVYDIKKNQIVEMDYSGNIVRTYGSFGQQANQFRVLINYELRKDGLYTIDHKNKYLSHWSYDGSLLSSLALQRLGRAVFITSDTILSKIADPKTLDDVFAFYYPSTGRFDTLRALPVYHDRGIANDGFFADNGQLFFHIAYYTKNIYCFNSQRLLFKFSTIDNNNKPPVALKVNNTYSPPSDAVATNGEATANSKYLFVLSQIRSKYENGGSFNSWSDIDVYSVKDGKYLFTYAIENYKSHFIDFFDVDDNKLILVTRGHISIVSL